MTYVHRDQSQINQRRLELIRKGYVTWRNICETIRFFFRTVRFRLIMGIGSLLNCCIYYVIYRKKLLSFLVSPIRIQNQKDCLGPVRCKA